MVPQLEQLIREIDVTQSKLILLVGPGASGKSRLLRELAERLGSEPLNVGLELARRLAATPVHERSGGAAELLRQMAAQQRLRDPLLLDNLELLFERSLQINPLELVKRLAHSRRVVAVWPGERHAGRLVYADVSHPEHRSYGCEGINVVETRGSATTGRPTA